MIEHETNRASALRGRGPGGRGLRVEQQQRQLAPRRRPHRSSASSSSGGGVAIKMQNIAFDPKAVTVKVGQKVTWTNDDSVDHNVTSESARDFKSENFGKGGTFSFTPDQGRHDQVRVHDPPGDDGDDSTVPGRGA